MQLSLNDIATQLNLQLCGNGEQIITGIAPLTSAGPNHVTFLSDNKYRKQLKDCKAAAVILLPALADEFSGDTLLSDDPYVSFALLAQLFDTTPACAVGIASSAIIADDVVLAAGVSIGANAVIEAGAILGEGVQVGAGCFIGQQAKLGANTKLWANVSVYHRVELGSDCLIQANTVIGSDGFGYANQRGQWIKIPQLGTVLIGDKTEIGASVTIDRGALGDTVISGNVIIDDQVHIAHNVEVGEGTAIAGATGIAGSAKIGRYCIIGGSVSINGHITLADQVTITGYSMVVKSIDKPGVYSSGMPALDNRSWRRLSSRLTKLDDMHKRIVDLEKQLKKD